jgi:hypothetical protein
VNAVTLDALGGGKEILTRTQALCIWEKDGYHTMVFYGNHKKNARERKFYEVKSKYTQLQATYISLIAFRSVVTGNPTSVGRAQDNG